MGSGRNRDQLPKTKLAGPRKGDGTLRRYATYAARFAILLTLGERSPLS